jgi:hypothetical protein
MMYSRRAMMSKLELVKRDAYDNSILTTSQRCPRKALYQYFYNRAADGRNVPIGFGLAYHKFREVLELNYLKVCVGDGRDLQEVAPSLFKLALYEALDGYENPPEAHNKAYLSRGRLELTCEQAFVEWMAEKRKNIFVVLEAEQAFQLPLPSGDLFGGRFDQILEWNGKLWIRDFKTTSRMGRDYHRMFDPNDQMTAYTWAASQLSGRPVQGVIIEVVYNTKTQGPKHHSIVSARTQAHIDEWLRNVQIAINDLNSYVESGYFPMRTTGCNDYGGCYFRDCCAMSSEVMRTAWLETKTIESHWDFMDPDKETGVTD